MILRLLFQTVFLALGQIWANKIRAILTTLGIVIAVWAAICTVAAVAGLKDFVLKEFATVGANKVWIFPQRPREQRDRYGWRQIRVTKEQADGIAANCPSISRLTPILEMTCPVQYGDITKPFVPVRGIRPSWHEIEQRFVTQGRTFSSVDEESRQNVCLINDKAIEEFGLEKDPTGDVILVDKRRFTIVGVVETKEVSPMFGGDEAKSEVYIPFSLADAMRPDRGMYIVAQTKSPELFEDAKAEITFYMRRVRNLKPEDPNTFGVEAIEQIIGQFKRIALVITVIMGVIAGISLFVGGIGIMNIMLASVSERTREIGLRKAVGARPEVILLQFLVEAVVLCLVGGAIGLAFGQGTILGMSMIFKSVMGHAAAPYWAVIVAIVLTALTGVVSGMFPAIRAACLNPINALRHE
jgi:putative ABC transport system permease protein